jgi:hypothetical protein
VSLWVVIAESAVSAQRRRDGSRRCGTSIGAMRMSAPLPAEATPARCHGRSSNVNRATNCRTVLPMPKICREANSRATRSGTYPPSSSSRSSVQNANCVSSEGNPTRRPSAESVGQVVADLPENICPLIRGHPLAGVAQRVAHGEAEEHAVDAVAPQRDGDRGRAEQRSAVECDTVLAEEQIDPGEGVEFYHTLRVLEFGGIFWPVLA